MTSPLIQWRDRFQFLEGLIENMNNQIGTMNGLIENQNAQIQNQNDQIRHQNSQLEIQSSQLLFQNSQIDILTESINNFKCSGETSSEVQTELQKHRLD